MSSRPSTAKHNPVQEVLAEALRNAVIEELEPRGLMEPVALGDAMGLAVIKISGPLERRDWGLQFSLAMIERLGLPIVITVAQQTAHTSEGVCE